MSSASQASTDRALATISRSRIEQTTLRLARVRSYPGDERELASMLAEELTEAGMTVELDEEFPDSPSVIGRLNTGRFGGPTLQFAGHTDTVPVPDVSPHVSAGLVHGRGVADMKGGLASMVEVVRVLAAMGNQFQGRILFTAYGQHEASPTGRLHGPLLGLLKRGIKGDAAIVAEGSSTAIPLKGKGSLIFEVTFHRGGDPAHEILGGEAIPNPLSAVHAFLDGLRELSAGWIVDDPELGPETYFIGSIRGGDLYNRIPTSARVEGTRRYSANRSFDEVRHELEEVASRSAAATGVSMVLECQRSGQPFAMPRSEPIVQAFRSAYRHVTGGELPFGVTLIAGDVNHFVNVGGVPTIFHGPGNSRAHATPEHVSIGELLRVAKVILLATLLYFDQTRESLSGE